MCVGGRKGEGGGDEQDGSVGGQNLTSATAASDDANLFPLIINWLAEDDLILKGNKKFPTTFRMKDSESVGWKEERDGVMGVCPGKRRSKKG